MKTLLVLMLAHGVVFAAPDLIVCHTRYALCAASATLPNGKTMTINGVVFPQGVAVCPVLEGESIGNRTLMGSCKAPAGPDTVWSTFSGATEYPQAPTWAVAPVAVRTFVTTSAPGGGMSNMWSYPCTVRPKKVNGATLADCVGPLNESPWNGGRVPAGSSVVTSAPVGAANPVGGNIP